MKVVDTNVLIYQVKGLLKQSLAGTDFVVSLITEIEVLGYRSLTPQMEADFRTLLKGRVLPIDESIKEEAIRLRRTTELRLPDSIVAATALTTGAELLTHDAGLLKVPGLVASAPPLK